MPHEESYQEEKHDDKAKIAANAEALLHQRHKEGAAFASGQVDVLRNCLPDLFKPVVRTLTREQQRSQFIDQAAYKMAEAMWDERQKWQPPK